MEDTTSVLSVVTINKGSWFKTKPKHSQRLVYLRKRKKGKIEKRDKRVMYLTAHPIVVVVLLWVFAHLQIMQKK